MEEEQMLTKEQILDMLDAGQYKELKEELGNMYPVDIAETLEDFEQKPLVMVFRLLAKEEAAETAGTEEKTSVRSTEHRKSRRKRSVWQSLPAFFQERG